MTLRLSAPIFYHVLTAKTFPVVSHNEHTWGVEVIGTGGVTWSEGAKGAPGGVMSISAGCLLANIGGGGGGGWPNDVNRGQRSVRHVETWFLAFFPLGEKKSDCSLRGVEATAAGPWKDVSQSQDFARFRATLRLTEIRNFWSRCENQSKSYLSAYQNRCW